MDRDGAIVYCTVTRWSAVDYCAVLSFVYL